MIQRLKRIGTRVASSPATARVLSNPNVQKVMIAAIRLPGEVRSNLEKNAEAVAKGLNLPTREDVIKLRKRIRDLEGAVERLKRELERERQARSAAVAAREAAGGGNGEPKADAGGGSGSPEKKSLGKKSLGKKSLGKKTES